MGTNYYLKENTCECCGRSEERHIGKSSGGWVFCLRVYPDEGINTLDDWKPRLAANPIKNEYGDDVEFDEMWKNITERRWEGRALDVTPFGYRSLADFHQKNSSEDGPNGLLRHQISGQCIGHGEGTWDYIIGEFL